MLHDFRPAGAAFETMPLGYSPMDAVHAEFDALLTSALNEIGDRESHLAAVVKHLTEHFEAEAGWMADSDYPNAECHLAEHAAVLASATEVLALSGERRLFVTRAFLGELATWFPAHSQHLDSALAHWMCKRSYGGKPLVFHQQRRISACVIVPD